MSNNHIQQFSSSADQEGTIRHHSPASVIDWLVVFALNDQRYGIAANLTSQVRNNAPGSAEV